MIRRALKGQQGSQPSSTPPPCPPHTHSSNIAHHQGVVIGPLLLCLLTVAASERLNSPNVEDGGGDSAPPASPLRPSPTAPRMSWPLTPPARAVLRVNVKGLAGPPVRVGLRADMGWRDFCTEVRARLALPEAPTELLTPDGVVVNDVAVLVEGELLLVPAPGPRLGPESPCGSGSGPGSSLLRLDSLRSPPDSVLSPPESLLSGNERGTPFGSAVSSSESEGDRGGTFWEPEADRDAHWPL